ncbi:MAG: hypothetical protein H6632_00960 [Anaerolineales bacterium]|nr:hypothetical protein [Anaerolineales bacterium]
MFQKIKSEVQIFITLVFAAAVLIFLSTSVQVSNGPKLAAAPTIEATKVLKSDTRASFRDKIIKEFGLTEDEVGIAAANLSISMIPGSVNAAPGSPVNFIITIKNNGTSPVNYIFFYSQFPNEYVVNSYEFSGTGSPAVFDGASTWFFPGPLAANGGTATVVVKGQVANDSCNKSVPYIAQVYPVFETNNIKQSTSTIIISGSQICGDLYLPYVSKVPTPTPQPLVYQETFSNENNDWPTGRFNIDDDDADDCAADIDSGKYEATAFKDETCFFPAPKAAERTTGMFEVEFKRDGDSDSDKFNAGIYINGEGGDEYYLFRVEFNKDNCDYRLYRKSDTKASGDCDDQSNGYKETNKLRITRNSSGVISIYLNDIFLKTYTDGSPLGGKGTGVYLRETSGDGKIINDFDNFTEYIIN